VTVVDGGTTAGMMKVLGTELGTLLYEIITTLGDDGKVTIYLCVNDVGTNVTEITTGLDHSVGIETDVGTTTTLVDGDVMAGT